MYSSYFVLPFCTDALAACNYLPQSREKIIAALFKALNSTNNELQEAGEACMRKVSTMLHHSLVLIIFFFIGSFIKLKIDLYFGLGIVF